MKRSWLTQSRRLNRSLNAPHGCAKLLVLFSSISFCISAGCANLVSVKVQQPQAFVFEGIKSVKERPDGRWLIEWEGVPATAEYEIFSREVPPENATPTKQVNASNAASTAAPEVYNFNRPLKKVSQNFFLTEKLLLKNSTCFVVRLVISGYDDRNTREICTGQSSAKEILINSGPAKFESLELINGAADGLLNTAEVAAGLEVALLKASGFSTALYALTLSSNACDDSVRYSMSSIPKSDDPDFVEGSMQKVCVKLSDSSGGVVYGASSGIVVDTAAPSPSNLASIFVNAAIDGKINKDEASANPATPLINFSSTEGNPSYALASSLAGCSTAVFSETFPLSNDLRLEHSSSKVVCIKVTDANGNSRIAATSALSVDTQQPNAPFVHVAALTDNYINAAESPDEGFVVELMGEPNASYTLTCTSNCTVLSGGSVAADGTVATGMLSASGNASLNLKTLTSGAFGFSSRLADSFGNMSSTTVTTGTALLVTPSLTEMTLSDEVVNTGEKNTPVTVTLKGTAGASYTLSCVSNCIVTSGGSGQLTADSTTAEISLSGSVEGSFVISAYVSDAAGNRSADSTVNGRLDETPPTITLIGPSVATLGAAQMTSYTVVYSDSGSGVKTESINLTTGAEGSVILGGTATDCTASVTGNSNIRTISLTGCSAPSGSVTLSIAAGTATDAAGNTAVAAGPSVAVTLDNIPPVLTISSPAENSEFKDSITVAGTCESGLSVVATVLNGGSTESNTCAGNGQYSIPLNLTGDDGDRLVLVSTDDGFNSPVVRFVSVKKRMPVNVSGFRILRYNVNGTATFRLSWSVPTSIFPTDTIQIRKGNSTLPNNCSDGELVASKSANDMFHELAVDSASVGNVSFAAFVRTSGGICADAASSAGALWQLVGSVRPDHTHDTASYRLQANQNEALVRIAEARTQSKADAWSGNNENTSTSVCGGGASCSLDLSNSAYFNVTNQSALLANTELTRSFDYSNGALTPPWAKRLHRFYFESADGKNAVLSDVFVWGRVPSGMVFVGGGTWPQNIVVNGSSPAISESYPITASSGDWDLVPHNFAIDKYEASLTSGHSLGAPATFPNAETGVLVSAPELPLTSKNWFAFQQGCLNRSYDNTNDFAQFVASADLSESNSHGALSIPNPRRKFHLTTGMEWTVAAYGTPDDTSCNVSGTKALNPASNNLNCSSAYSVRNMIGNVWEWTGDWGRTGPRGAMERWVGTSAVQSSVSTTLLYSMNANSSTRWNFRSGFPISLGENTAISGDVFSPPVEDGGTVQGGNGGGIGWAAVRGGYWEIGSYAGRFAVSLDISPSYVGVAGGRCALSAPQPRARIARFGNVSDGNAARLFWLVHDTENTSSVQLGRASSKAEIDAWTGISSSTGVTIETHTPGVAFTNNCGWSPAAGNTSTGHMCDNAISGDNYYKLCVTNPSLPQVSDDLTLTQRTVCSNAVMVKVGATPPQLQSLTSGVLLQNDSDGGFARFYWKESGGGNVLRKLIFGVDKNEVERWNGDAPAFNAWDEGNGWNQATYAGSMSGLKILSGGPAGNSELTNECAQAHLSIDGNTFAAYTPDVGATSGHTTGATHYACVNLSRFPKWSKFWFKVAIASSDGAGTPLGGWQMSDAHSAGYVPTGMTLVAAEEWQSLSKTNADLDPAEDYTNWPRCVGASGSIPTINSPAHIMPGVNGWPFSNGVGCVYDFAMDKYEGYDAGGTWASGAFTSQTDFAGNGTTSLLRSLRNKTASYNRDWFSFKRGCDNRSAELQTAGFIAAGAQPLNRVRMSTGVEWTVSSFGTKDENVQGVCNVDSAGLNADGTGSYLNCISRFGSFDQIGNLWEWTDEVTTGGVRSNASNWMRFLGTSAATAFPTSGNGTIPDPVLSETSVLGVAVWDMLTSFPSATVSTGTPHNSRFAPAIQNPASGAPAGGVGGADWATYRGGRWKFLGTQGRFSVRQASSPLGQGSDDGSPTTGTRCVVMPP